MADKHEEGPIHQAPWVFYLTVAVCYGVLGLIMFAKWSSENADMGDIAYVFAVQAGLLTVFVTVFGGLMFLANKLIGATTAKD